MTELEKLKSGLEYCYDDAEVAALKERAIVWCREYNAIDDTDYAAQRAQLEKMLGAIGEKVWIGKVFNCDNGTVGAAGLDVYEEESEWFYEDRSDVTRQFRTLRQKPATTPCGGLSPSSRPNTRLARKRPTRANVARFTPQARRRAPWRRS